MYPVLTGSLQVETVTIAIRNLPPRLQGTKLVQLSDFHYEGWGLSEKLLDRAIGASNEAEPDLVLLTGDYITKYPTRIHQLAAKLKDLQSRAGIYAIFGNHDLLSRPQIADAFTPIGINILWNQIAYPLGSGLALVGMADFYSPEFHPQPLLTAIPPEIPRLVLSHNPDTAAEMQPYRENLRIAQPHRHHLHHHHQHQPDSQHHLHHHRQHQPDSQHHLHHHPRWGNRRYQ
ncbi:MAG TPA: metallophosphoesterase [Oscillatoriaceae cyanobacterium M33_DOE_052]|nr:metallophosphoesterase [Oscillatoriaceae cyanobacterium M33_DOE_052]